MAEHANETIIHRQEVQLEVLNRRCNQLTRTTTSLSEEIKTKQTTIQRLTQQLSYTQIKLEDTEKALTTLNLSYEKQQQLARAQQSRLIVLTTNVNSQKASNSSYQKQLAEAREQISYLQSRQATLQDTLRWYEISHSQQKTNQDFQALNALLRTNEESNAALLKENAALKNSLNQKQKQIDTLTSALTKENNHRLQAIENVDLKQGTVASEVQSVQEVYQEMVAALTKEIENKNKTIAQLHALYQVQLQDEDGVLSWNKSIKLRGAASSEEETSALNRLYYVTQEIYARNKMLQGLQTKYATLLVQESLLQKSVSELKNSMAKKNQLLSQIQRKHQDAVNKLAQSQKLVEQLEERNKMLEASLREGDSRLQSVLWENEAYYYSLLSQNSGISPKDLKDMVESTKQQIILKRKCNPPEPEHKYLTVRELILKNRELQQLLKKLLANKQE